MKKYCYQKNIFGFRTKCFEDCPKRTVMFGPNDKGERIKKENCADAWQPLLTTELTANITLIKGSIDKLNNIIGGFRVKAKENPKEKTEENSENK